MFRKRVSTIVLRTLGFAMSLSSSSHATNLTESVVGAHVGSLKVAAVSAEGFIVREDPTELMMNVREDGDSSDLPSSRARSQSLPPFLPYFTRPCRLPNSSASPTSPGSSTDGSSVLRLPPIRLGLDPDADPLDDEAIAEILGQNEQIEKKDGIEPKPFDFHRNNGYDASNRLISTE